MYIFFTVTGQREGKFSREHIEEPYRSGGDDILFPELSIRQRNPNNFWIEILKQTRALFFCASPCKVPKAMLQLRYLTFSKDEYVFQRGKSNNIILLTKKNIFLCVDDRLPAWESKGIFQWS